jgi:hypothetical protein
MNGCPSMRSYNRRGGELFAIRSGQSRKNDGASKALRFSSPGLERCTDAPLHLMVRSVHETAEPGGPVRSSRNGTAPIGAKARRTL